MAESERMTLYAEKLLPHDVEAEESVLGSLLIDGDSLTRVASMLKPEDFYRERNRLCYEAAIALSARDISIDQVTLAGELQRTEALDAAGGMAYLSHLVSITPTSIHAEDYALVISQHSTMRRLIQAASRISELGYGGTDNVDATIRKAEDALFAVRGTTQTKDFVPLRDIYDEYLQEQASTIDAGIFTNMPVMTGYPDLDETLGGLQKADMIILGARPSLGKTTLALNIAINAARSGQRCGIFSLEMTRQQLAMRVLSAESGVDFHRLRLGVYTFDEEQRIIDSIGRLSELPVYIDDTRFQTSTEMRSKARRLSLENGLDLLVVDYLQLIQGRPGITNRVQEISEISRSLKILAGDLNVVLLTCSQLNRMLENRPSHRPQLSDLRDSGSLEQDADVVMFIHREDVYTTPEEWEMQHPEETYPRSIADIIVAKHRNGPTGAVQLQFVDSLVRFDSIR